MSASVEDFQDRLDAAFDGRLRIRYSQKSQELQVEQRVARGLVNFPVRDDQDDEAIRLRDGYFYVMSIRNGDRMPCPKGCGTELKVPIRQIRELSCPLCRAKGLEHRVSAGHFPLDDQLIEYLRTIDPLNGASKELRNKINAHNEAHTQRQRQDVLNRMSDAAGEDFSRIAGIPQVGYTGAKLLESTN